MATLSAKKIIGDLENLADPVRAAISRRYFKTGPGEYGAGDIFIGLTVPQVRQVVKKNSSLSPLEIERLLCSPIHECRLTALLIMVEQYKSASRFDRQKLHQLYLASSRYINNWDLVDSSAACLIGNHTYKKSTRLLSRLANSKNIWERRMAIVATHYGIKRGDAKEALRVARLLLNDTHDLIHKAVGWMLREIGVYCSRQQVVDFLNAHYTNVPRTTLRYAIEHFPTTQRKRYLRGPLVS